MDHYNLYKKYKYKYKILKGGLCTPFELKDCIYSQPDQKCTYIPFNIQNNQKRCICNYKTNRCVLTKNKPGKDTLSEKNRRNKIN